MGNGGEEQGREGGYVHGGNESGKGVVWGLHALANNPL